MTQKLTKEQLKDKLDSNTQIKLVNVLPKESFEEKHIPGSINIPVTDIENIAPQRLDKNDEIVVYCADFECSASPKAANKLEELGYKNVYDYEGGIDDWEKAGYKLVEATT